MKYEVFPLDDGAGDYGVEAIALPGEGEIFGANFAGPESRERAEEYPAWKSEQARQPKAA